MPFSHAHRLPIVILTDTPRFTVGPQPQEAPPVRHLSRLFIPAAHFRLPMVSVVLRKAYGLGAMAMAGGSMHAPLATVAWPGGEFGGMGLEGAVRLGYRKELEAVPEGDAREALFRRLVEVQYEKGHALNMAATLEIDAVIDPAQTREWIVQALQAGATRPREDSVPAIDSW